MPGWIDSEGTQHDCFSVGLPDGNEVTLHRDPGGAPWISGAAIQKGQILIAVDDDGGELVLAFSLASDDGGVLTNDDGLIVVSG